MVGEIGDEKGMEMVAQYTSGGDKLHMGYCFDFLSDRCDARYIRSVIQKFEQVAGDGWACWALSNHDCARLATRWGDTNPPAALLRLAPALQLSLRGSSCIYQGDELGLPEANIEFEHIQDPYGIAMWPEFKGRDGCRTPFPWAAELRDFGFSNTGVKPWLPIPESHRTLAADIQEADANSVLHHYRHLLDWRRGIPALIQGSLDLLPEHDQVVAYVRGYNGERILCAFNLSPTSASFALPSGETIAEVLNENRTSGASAQRVSVDFDPWGVLFARLA